MPSEYCTSPSTPGNWAGVDAGTWDRSAGKVTGRWPDGSTAPKRTAASAVPLLSPGYQASTTEATWLSQGMATGAPASTTTANAADLAAAAAWLMPGARSDGVAQLRLADSPPPDSCSV